MEAFCDRRQGEYFCLDGDTGQPVDSRGVEATGEPLEVDPGGVLLGGEPVCPPIGGQDNSVVWMSCCQVCAGDDRGIG